MLPDITDIRNSIEEFEKVGDNEGLMIVRLQYREALVRQRCGFRTTSTDQIRQHYNQWHQWPVQPTGLERKRTPVGGLVACQVMMMMMISFTLTPRF